MIYLLTLISAHFLRGNGLNSEGKEEKQQYLEVLEVGCGPRLTLGKYQIIPIPNDNPSLRATIKSMLD